MNQIARNKIEVKDSFFEMIRMRSLQGFYANYDIRIKPSLKKAFTLSLEDEIHDSYVVSLKNGINKVYKSHLKYDIQIIPLDILISKNTFHPVDSKPICYEVSVKYVLEDYLKLTNHTRTVVNPELKTTNYSFTKYLLTFKSNNLEYQIYSLETNKLLNPSTISILKNYELLMTDDNLKIIIQTKSNSFSTRHRQIQLWFKTDQFANDEILKYYRLIDLIKNDIYKSKMNLNGFNIYFEKNDFQKNHKINSYLNFEWALRNLLSSNESVEILT